jgi:hypothetical protein
MKSSKEDPLNVEAAGSRFYYGAVGSIFVISSEVETSLIIPASDGQS